MGKSSKDKRDAYYRLAKEQNWRARSAFKLIQIDEQFDLFSYQDPSQCTRVVDLCAAPGSWSQVLSRVLIKGESFGRRAWVDKMKRHEELKRRQDKDSSDLDVPEISTLDISDDTELQPRPNVHIVAIDLQPMAPLAGITTLKADITHPTTAPLLLKALNPDNPSSPEPVDLVISDGAPDVTGLHDLDIYIQAQLLFAALSLAMKVLRPGGKFVAKIFRGRDVDLIYAQLKCVFEKVTVAKPRSSRASSLEAFVVCEGYTGIPLEEDNTIISHSLKQDAKVSEEDEEPQQPKSQVLREDGVLEISFQDSLQHNQPPPQRWIPPFLACGDLSAWDSDATYKLPPGHVSLDPVQPPTAPPYKAALERRRAEGGAYGKTGSKK
ncbi:putative tRNA (cytidine(32)/guanosine(34)-2'-O)-methyltransferase [Cyphellophora attinorum]|uniref:Putative tRNA (cytidine(32)/guanosine(34)-2'-O)-methyltransferase n=1 Tax=Cyphellophora attinorum TaxID=1664694 RepID=A0A0N1P088_9EURO|nr:putative tRNA (cytidine(32)/guanosine(34)-2'-O)-methyltransferase [Phialophora attinorum]KPI39983.1 putative tRNA (cytidine(32)/guanosine(34)-2'-O)-methyltransferase [Phialophora attinorum]